MPSTGSRTCFISPRLSHFIRRFNYTNNIVGSMNVLKVKCFVFTSSIAAYGAGQTPMHEQLTPEPEDLGDRYRNVIGIFMNQLMRGEPMTVSATERRRARSGTSAMSRPSSRARSKCLPR